MPVKLSDIARLAQVSVTTASYVINGQSLIAPEGEDAFGGEREDGPTLKDAPPVLREHLEKVWNSVLKRPWSEAAPEPDDDDPDQ